MKKKTKDPKWYHLGLAKSPNQGLIQEDDLGKLHNSETSVSVLKVCDLQSVGFPSLPGVPQRVKVLNLFSSPENAGLSHPGLGRVSSGSRGCPKGLVFLWLDLPGIALRG